MPSQRPRTLQDAFDNYLANITSRRSTPLAQAYRQALTLFTQILRDEHLIEAHSVQIQRLNASWVRGFLHYLQENRSVETEHLYTRAVLDFYNHAVSKAWIAADDLPSLEDYILQHRRPKEHNVPDIPSDAVDQVITYVKQASPPHDKKTTRRQLLQFLRDKAFTLTLANTGLRISEICTLRRYQVNLDHHILILSQDTDLPLSKVTTSAIRNYLRERSKLDHAQALLSPEHLPLFARHDKRVGKKVLPISRWTGINIIDHWTALALPPDIQHTLKTTGQRITPHTFRHHFVKTLLDRTGNIAATQILARHTDRSTTRRYLHDATEEDTNVEPPTSSPDTNKTE